MICPQDGHLAFLPIAVSGAESVLPHDGQFILMGTVVSPTKNVDGDGRWGEYPKG
jgi:hypothetical protein